MSGDQSAAAAGVTRRSVSTAESVAANRRWWDDETAAYQAEHGDFLRDDGFIWGPEGLDEADAHLLGDVEGLRGKRVLEVGAGAAQCSRWLLRHGARPVALDLSAAQLAHSRALDRAHGLDDSGRAGGPEGADDPERATELERAGVPLVQADAARLPLADATVDLACSAFGAVPFVADSAAVMREVARVLRPGGRWVFSVSHPIRWSFPDDPGAAGLVARDSYFDRRPYVEHDEHGSTTYAEHHRTVGDRVREIVAAGLVLLDLVEPEWPAELTRCWGGWSPLRGQVLPGTAIFVCARPAR